MIYRLILAGLCALSLSGAALANLIQSPAGTAASSCTGTNFTLCAHTILSSADNANVLTGDNGSGTDTSSCATHCLIVVGLSAYNGGTPPTNVTDNMGNTYTGTSTVTSSPPGGAHAQLWYVIDGTTGAGHKWTTTGGSGTAFPVLTVTVFNDSVGTPTLTDNLGAGNSSAVANLDTLALTYSASALLVEASAGFANGVSHAVTFESLADLTFLTISDSNVSNTSVAIQAAMAYVQLALPGDISVQRFTASPDTQMSFRAASFQP